MTGQLRFVACLPPQPYFYMCPDTTCLHIQPVTPLQANGLVPIACPCGRRRRANDTDILAGIRAIPV